MVELEKILRLVVDKRVPFPGEEILGVFAVGDNTVYVELASESDSEDTSEDTSEDVPLPYRLALVDAAAGVQVAEKSTLMYPHNAFYAGDGIHLYAALKDQGLAVIKDGTEINRLDLHGRVGAVACAANGLVAAVVDKSVVVVLRDLKEEARIDLWPTKGHCVGESVNCAVCDDGVYAAVGGFLFFVDPVNSSVCEVKLPDSLGYAMVAQGASAFVSFGVYDVATLSGGDVARVNSFRDCVNSLFADHQGLLYVVQGSDQVVVIKDGQRLGTTCFSDPRSTSPTVDVECIEVSRGNNPTVYLAHRREDTQENELLLLKKRWYHVAPEELVREWAEGTDWFDDKIKN